MNPWLKHVAEYRKKNPSMSYSDALKNAKSSYTKVGRGQTGRGMKGKGHLDDILKDFKEARLGSKAIDYISKKVKQEGFGR